MKQIKEQVAGVLKSQKSTSLKDPEAQANESDENSKNVRKLRSNDGIASRSKSVVFNFDNINGLIFKNDPVRIIRAKSDKYYKSGGGSDLPQLKLTSKPINLVIAPPYGKVRKAVAAPDPLPDQLFEAFHKKMRKDEKVMTNEDRSRLLSDMDNLNSRHQLLNQYDWIRHLPLITQVNNINDFEELELKNELTKSEIDRLNRKHENWKKRYEQITSEIKEFETYSSEPELDDYSAPITVLQERRRHQRSLKHGPIIKLNLQNGYFIIMDPILPPRIEKCPKSSKKRAKLPVGREIPAQSVIVNSKERLDGVSSFSRRPLKGHLHVPKRDSSNDPLSEEVKDSKQGRAKRILIDSNEVDLKASTGNSTRSRARATKHIPLLNFENLTYQEKGFQLPLKLKRSAKETRDIRHSFRKSIQ